MHDLLNDLAKYVCGEICYRLGVDRPGSVPKKTRHFSIVKYVMNVMSIGVYVMLKGYGHLCPYMAVVGCQ